MSQACSLKFSLDALTLTSGRAVRSHAESPRQPKIPASFSVAAAKFAVQGQVTIELANKKTRPSKRWRKQVRV